MYSDTVKNEAFLLYCLGHSYDSIVDRLKGFHKRSCNKLNRSTIRNWSKAKGWEKKRDEERNRLAIQRTQEASNVAKVSAEKIGEMLPSLLEEVHKMDFSSKEGGIYATNSLLKSYREFTGENKPSINVHGDEEGSLFLQALYSIDEIRVAMEKYRVAIGERFKELKAEKKGEEELKKIGKKGDQNNGNFDGKSK